MPKLKKLNQMNKKSLVFFRGFFLTNIMVVVAIFLNGCAHKIPPQQLLGINDAEWNSYDKNKQKELEQTYKQIDLANQVEDQKAQEQVLGRQQGNTVKVKVFDGSALMPPFVAWQAFAPAVFTISEGTCQNVWLTQLDGMAKTSLRSCYKNKMLHFDPSHYESDKLDGTASIPYSPLWDQGFVYHNINSYGFVKLKNVNVAIKQESF